MPVTERRTNAPGQPALEYRLGTHAEFLEAMVAALPREQLPPPPGTTSSPRPLDALRTRSLDDPAIALLDAWAVVADVLTFYQERIANEGFLRTASERRSVLELARAIGYELNPGVAAGTWLSFAVEDAEGAPRRARIDTGLKVLSVPRQDEHPQTFETVESLGARAEWNALRPRLRAPRMPVAGDKQVWLKGLQNRLVVGDVLLLVGAERRNYLGSDRWDLRTVSRVELRTDEDATIAYWDKPLGVPVSLPAVDPRIYVFRQRASIFGYNAPTWKAMPDAIRSRYATTTAPSDWPDMALSLGNPPALDLDRVYRDLLPGGWAALISPTYTEIGRITNVVPFGAENFAMTSQVTRLVLDKIENLNQFGRRNTLVLCGTEELPRVEQPITDDVAGSQIELDRSVPGLATGAPLVIEGMSGGVRESEPAVIAGITTSLGRTVVALTRPLSRPYTRDTVTIHANVVRATHGETVDQVLGSGDSSRPNQRFELSRRPLTFVSAPTPSGGLNTLAVRVDDVLWDEVASLHGQDPEARVYMTRIQDDGRAIVVFGDGHEGARLPTGRDNVRARYRTGIGPEGELEAGQLTLLQTRPLGVRSVSNPRPSSGAAAPEELAEARRNAPMTVLTLDRVVSLRDFEDFARAFGGIGKAQAVRIWDGGSEIVHLTLASASGAPADALSDQVVNLRGALDGKRDPNRPVELAGHTVLYFLLDVGVYIDRRHRPEAVLDAVRTELATEFSFERRQFGQAVTAAEVMEVAQRVAGVVAVDVNSMTYGPPHLGDRPTSSPRRRRGRLRVRRATPVFLPAFSAYLGPDGILPGELLLTDRSLVTVREVRA